MARDLQAAKTAVPAKASEVPKSWTGTVDPHLTSVGYLNPNPNPNLNPNSNITPSNSNPNPSLTLTLTKAQP